MILGDSDRLDLEHRCYNGVSLAAAIGCLSAVIFNSILGISLPHTAITFIVSLTYLWLYFRGRFSVTDQPVSGQKCSFLRKTDTILLCPPQVTSDGHLNI